MLLRKLMKIIVGQKLMRQKLLRKLKDLDKSNQMIILVESNTPKSIDFIGVELFDWDGDAYLAKFVDCLKSNKN